MPSPFLATSVVAASALNRGGNAAQKSEFLPKISNGSLLATLAIDEGAKHRPLQTSLQAVRAGNGFKLSAPRRWSSTATSRTSSSSRRVPLAPPASVKG